jgi:hypothetical protein
MARLSRPSSSINTASFAMQCRHSSRRCCDSSDRPWRSCSGTHAKPPVNPMT